uniref:Uncharacterized protein n=1 Tax=virus sp. ctx9V1 TaxID=2828001 RepID=A0A8S5RDW5_9VIRU|nr:MAG TPA: hypothetical protein [virus sp. ctx9V1]
MGLDKPVNANCIIRMQFLLQAYYPIVVIGRVQLSLYKSVYNSRTSFRKLSKQNSNRVSSYQSCFIQ